MHLWLLVQSCRDILPVFGKRDPIPVDETMASRGTGLDGDPSFGQRHGRGVKPASTRSRGASVDRVVNNCK